MKQPEHILMLAGFDSEKLKKDVIKDLYNEYTKKYSPEEAAPFLERIDKINTDQCYYEFITDIEESGLLNDIGFWGLSQDDVDIIERYYFDMENMLEDITEKGGYEIVECDGLADYSYCIVDIKNDNVVNFTEEHRLSGIMFRKIEGNFNADGGGLKSMFSTSNAGSGYGLCKLIWEITGNININHNEIQCLNGLTDDVGGYVYARNNPLRAIRASYDGFWANNCQIVDKIITDQEVPENLYVHTKFEIVDHGTHNGCNYKTINQVEV